MANSVNSWIHLQRLECARIGVVGEGEGGERENGTEKSNLEGRTLNNVNWTAVGKRKRQ